MVWFGFGYTKLNSYLGIMLWNYQADNGPYTILYAVTYNIIAKVTLTTATNHTTLDSMVTSPSKLYNVLNACLVYCLVVICFLFVCFL